MPEDERRLTAYHEAGHAYIQLMLPECDDLHKVTIIPRGQYLGASFSLPTERRGISRKKIHGDICVACGGRLCEEIFCDDITAGARSDIEQATRYARAMVYGLVCRSYGGNAIPVPTGWLAKNGILKYHRKPSVNSTKKCVASWMASMNAPKR